MKTKKMLSQNRQKAEQHSEKAAARGSGYTYDEKERPSDQSVLLDEKRDETIVPLPKLGENHF